MNSRSIRRHEDLHSRRTKASAEQRAKVAAAGCLVCGREPVDPAHLVPQRLGGCSCRDCVIALCRAHHRLFDQGRLRLGAYLGPEQGGEISHALTHVGAAELREALLSGWPAPWNQTANQGEDDEQEQRSS